MTPGQYPSEPHPSQRKMDSIHAQLCSVLVHVLVFQVLILEL